MEQAKARLIVDEHSVKEYFKQYANANLDDAEIRDSVLNYFVDKIYVYDDKITVTGCFSGEPTEIPFTEFSEFDCETVSSTPEAGITDVLICNPCFFHSIKKRFLACISTVRNLLSSVTFRFIRLYFFVVNNYWNSSRAL